MWIFESYLSFMQLPRTVCGAERSQRHKLWVGGFCGLLFLQERVTDFYHPLRALADTPEDAVSHKGWISGEFNRAQDLSKDIVNHPL